MEAFHFSKQLYRALLGLRHNAEALYLFTNYNEQITFRYSRYVM